MNVRDRRKRRRGSFFYSVKCNADRERLRRNGGDYVRTTPNCCPSIHFSSSASRRSEIRILWLHRTHSSLMIKEDENGRNQSCSAERVLACALCASNGCIHLFAELWPGWLWSRNTSFRLQHLKVFDSGSKMIWSDEKQCIICTII